jgi:hypothetical protein
METAEVRRLVESLEAEVNNGGFDQFFFNAAGDDAAATIQALEAIRASTTASLLRAACARFPGGMPPGDRDARQELLETVSPDSEAFEDEDQRFYAYEDDLAGLLSAYIARPD